MSVWKIALITAEVAGILLICWVVLELLIVGVMEVWRRRR